MLSLFGLSFGLRAVVIVTLLTGAASFGAGVWVRDAFCDAAEYKDRVEALKLQLKAREEADAVLAARVETDAKERATLTEKINAMQSQISRGDCLTDDDARWLRDLWPK